ncbi:MAG TPA: UvrD-helicase domain-containing protein [Noviherbaspirillum sp.]|nr:UvrD-helicase domain-containing protein [Noviherbaspirillum sp.]
MNYQLAALTLDTLAIENVLMGRTDLTDLIENENLPKSDAFCRVVALGSHLFVVGRNASYSGYVTILLDKRGPIFGLNKELRATAFERILRVSINAITRRNAIPISWRPYHAGKLISFQSSAKTTGESARIVIDSNTGAERHVFVFLLDRVKSDLSSVVPDETELDVAAQLIPNLLSAEEQPRSDITELHGALRLSSSLLNQETARLTFNEWYDLRLTKEQRKFVDSDLSQSMRLVGPAGSGKTVALVVKALKEIQAAQAVGKKLRVLVLTHAVSTENLIEDLVHSMDPSGRALLPANDDTSLEVATIFSLANRHMRYDLEGLEPLSLDGMEGRDLQCELISSLVCEYTQSDWVAFKSACSPDFTRNMEAGSNSLEHKLFVWELMNEFACVLDADGIRSMRERKKHYLEDVRKAWMMPLACKEEREVVLELYGKFRSTLKDMKTLGVDQMIADYLNWLDSNRWEALRESTGYDVIFVDELHLFNRQERMVFRHLMKDLNSMPVVVMAYDTKQSPRDTFIGLSGSSKSTDYWKDAKLGKTEKFELADVFRYTPQIASVLACIDKCFPGQNLDDDWPQYNGISQIADGPVPTLTEVRYTRELFDLIFPRAKDAQRQLGGKKRVAVLCASNTLFKLYAAAGKYSDDFLLISSREDLPKLKSHSKKYILSTPEFVAGLQFETVYLIEVNEDEVPDLNFRASAQRKFVSILYLGASRAERVLEIFATKEHGGITRLLEQALIQGAIQRRELQGT